MGGEWKSDRVHRWPPIPVTVFVSHFVSQGRLMLVILIIECAFKGTFLLAFTRAFVWGGSV